MHSSCPRPLIRRATPLAGLATWWPSYSSTSAHCTSTASKFTTASTGVALGQQIRAGIAPLCSPPHWWLAPCSAVISTLTQCQPPCYYQCVCLSLHSQHTAPRPAAQRKAWTPSSGRKSTSHTWKFFADLHYPIVNDTTAMNAVGRLHQLLQYHVLDDSIYVAMQVSHWATIGLLVVISLPVYS